MSKSWWMILLAVLPFVVGIIFILNKFPADHQMKAVSFCLVGICGTLLSILVLRPLIRSGHVRPRKSSDVSGPTPP